AVGDAREDPAQGRGEPNAHARPVTDDADGASTHSRRRSRTHFTEGPIAGMQENKSGNNADRFCSLIKDRSILADRLKHIPSLPTRFATLSYDAMATPKPDYCGGPKSLCVPILIKKGIASNRLRGRLGIYLWPPPPM